TPLAEILSVLRELRDLRNECATAVTPGKTAAGDVLVRLARRIKALEQLALALDLVQIEVEAPPGAVAIAGEDFSCKVRLLTGRGDLPPLRAEGLDGVGVTLTSLGRSSHPASSSLAEATIRIPLGHRRNKDPMAERFQADRFEPP